ncbi:MAG: DUF1015 domain-containing protein [Treponema sp.]|jgi:hypothetical protein|nr:DUF1015 domain-containing protein [Treponema sp.]
MVEPMDIQQRLAALGAAIPEIILPGPGLDLRRWAVIACDQFTQDRSYWAGVEEVVGDAPSTLRLIFPEVYLEEAGRETRIQRIHSAMERYIAGGTLRSPGQCAVYLERRTSWHERRRGLVLAIDLEHYDWREAAQPLIRATEGTAPERLPPRMAIRRGAPLEIPHIILLIDDEEDALLPSLGRRAQERPPLYEASFMGKAGSLTGWALDREEDWAVLAGGLETLARRSLARYAGPSPAGKGSAAERPFLYAVGDGNHSLAAAKALWEEVKTSGAPAAHGGRWALAELENLYDPGISFQPIHRILFGADARDLTEALAALPGFARYPAADRDRLSQAVKNRGAGKSRAGILSETACVLIESDAPGLLVSSLQPLLDRFIQERNRSSPQAPVRIDYIHGEEEVFRLVAEAASRPGGPPAAGLLLPPVQKGGLFETVARSGPLPRKSFSMGAAEEKRFYLECRKLF